MVSVSESVTHELPNSSDRVDSIESPVASATLALEMDMMIDDDLCVTFC